MMTDVLPSFASNDYVTNDYFKDQARDILFEYLDEETRRAYDDHLKTMVGRSTIRRSADGDVVGIRLRFNVDCTPGARE